MSRRVSTPFPYTTLFRSDVEVPHVFILPFRGPRSIDVGQVVVGAARLALERAWRPHADRKSTRLNSSHLVISYAVFCFKKKKGKYLTMVDKQDGQSNTLN